MAHTCHAHDCARQVPPRMLMCLPHWRMLPRKIQRAIWREYRQGQERDKAPSLRYLSVQQLAIGYVAFVPNDEAAARTTAHYLHRAVEIAKRAIEAGEGDPLTDLLDSIIAGVSR